MTKVDLQNEGQGGKKRDLRNSTKNVLFYIDDFVQNFTYPVTCIYAKR